MFHLHTEQVLRAPIERAFAFYADAGNLEAITPPFLKFRILTPRPIPMHEGAMIDYALKLHGVPIRWRTRINAWEPNKRFIDEQIKGPYLLWVHEHTFEPTLDGGTIVRDHVRYRVPGGALANRLFVRKQLDEIFAFRAVATKRLIEGDQSVPTGDRSEASRP